MHPHAELIQKFYSAFAERDHAAMIECYHDDIVFSDPVFPELKGKSAGAMWAMLCIQAISLKIESSGIDADDQSGKAHWDAWYPFSATKRDVLNKIDASFEFKDGKIIKHTDYFDFWRWSRQALGLPGYLLGWSGFLQNTVRKQAGGNLKKFIDKNAEYQ